MTVVGVVAPGAMGAVVAGCLVDNGTAVLWASDGRSDVTRQRANAAGLQDVGDLATLCAQADVVLSICPPHAALETARQVMAQGFDGLYVDANAVSPDTARRLLALVEPTARFVDGGIIGAPPRTHGSTRLYLAGEDADQVATLFVSTPLDAVVLDGAVPAASALKIAYAAWTKGTSALLLTIRAYAQAEGVADDLLAEWEKSQAELPARVQSIAETASPKAWRWIGEMEEIAAAFDAVGLPPGFHQGAAATYARLQDRRDTAGTSIDDVVGDLLNP